MTDIRELYRRQAMGDEDAIEELSQIMEQIPQGQSVVQQQAQDYEGRKAYLRKVLEWSRNNPDVAYDDESYAHAIQVDANLARAYPHMSEEWRLAFAADITREELGDAESRDNAGAIAEMAKGRLKESIRHKRTRASTGENDSQEAEIVADRSDAIAELKKMRMPHNNDAALAAQERADRDPRRPRMQRAVPFPER